MNGFQQLGSGLVRTWWFWAFVLLVIPNCALHSEGTCYQEPCGGGDPKPKPCDPVTDPKCEEPCPPDVPDCHAPCPNPDNPACVCPDANNPMCDMPCPDPNNPVCNPPCDKPDCMPTQFFPGSTPSDAIFCDIPRPPKADPECADDNDIAAGIPLTQAGTALATTQHKNIALDYSEGAIAACGGKPKKIEFFGLWPDGLTTCINCNEKIPNTYANPIKACIAKCNDLINQSGGPFPLNVQAYCDANVKIATNLNPDICYPGACTGGGNPDPAYDDERRHPEPVKWIDPIGTTDNGGTNSLSRNTPTSGTFDAGAASAQTIIFGDAWVDFSVTETSLAHLLGVRESRDGLDNPCSNPVNCPDMDPTNHIGFALSLNSDGIVYVVEALPVPTTKFTYDPYSAGQRYRVHITDNNDNNKTATISYSRIDVACNDGMDCGDLPFYTSVAHPRYPLRVDTSFRELGATVANVNIVRIKP